MNQATGEGDGATLPLLRFCAGGILFCADAGQIESVAAWDGTAWDPFVWLRDELGCRGLTEHGAPVLLTVKTGKGPPYRVAVDRMDDICQVACREIRPFPPLVEPFALEKGLWGVAFPGGQTALLIDFLLLARKKRT
jgi:hypothetical protein